MTEPDLNFDTALAAYNQALTALEAATHPTRDQALAVLDARDTLATLQATRPTPAQLTQLTASDRRLKRQAGRLTQTLDLPQWRSLANPPANAWWWFLEPPKWSNRFDPAFNLATLLALTVSLSLIVDTSIRFFPTGLNGWGTLAVAIQSLLALIPGTGTLTQQGRTSIDRLLSATPFIPNHCRQEVGATVAIAVASLLLTFHSQLPHLSRWFQHRGIDRYENSQLANAEANYQLALSLAPSNTSVHYYLGLVYEDLQAIDQAKAAYWAMIRDSNPQDRLLQLKACNNLGRLYILENNERAATPLLRWALQHLTANLLQTNPEARNLQYKLLKNLGWARLNEALYVDATNFLNDAITVDASQPDAHCLLAQVREQQKQPQAALPLWRECERTIDAATFLTSPELDTWSGIAHERLANSTP